ncbi:MAG: hypothetical protein CME62_04840 [Halobacteriovoraceae bacterium]|nr:hypothetical protein [Halobacteriovoraceae bacterium]
MQNCPCQSGDTYQNCCEKFHKKEAHPPTAEKLMRARYCAFATNNIQFIADTHIPGTTDFDIEEAREWATTSTWEGLDILNTEKGEENDQTGQVEFRAIYTDDKEKKYVHHELSTFKKVDDVWYYEDGQIVGTGPLKRATPKVGRNDPCPCGSGKKFKKCCGNK